MMDVRLTLIRISSHDIISADPVSMAEEIGALKREVSLLKRMLAEAMEGGIGGNCGSPGTTGASGTGYGDGRIRLRRGHASAFPGSRWGRI